MQRLQREKEARIIPERRARAFSHPNAKPAALSWLTADQSAEALHARG
jgi:hypothetical protein